MTHDIVMSLFGLGDSAHFVHYVQPWLRRGHKVRVAAGAFHWLYQAAGVPLTTWGTQPPWWEPPASTDHPSPWSGSKVGYNLDNPHPLPSVGTASELWDEVVNTRYDLGPKVSQPVKDRVRKLLDGLPRPLVALHCHGHSSTDRKDFKPELESETVSALLDSGASVVYLDWGGVYFRRDHMNFRRVTGYDVETLVGVISACDVLVGIDSGPYHVARLTKTPRIGVWWGITPWHACLPTPTDLNLFAAGNPVTQFKKEAFAIREVPSITAETIRSAVNTVCLEHATR